MNNWIKGLKEYNKGADAWCIPKKGSKGYNEIMNKQKPTPHRDATKKPTRAKEESKKEFEERERKHYEKLFKSLAPSYGVTLTRKMGLLPGAL
tara:strand:- start:518 stop:796 length:279 start_codon:yes stop_codon:yes gene_type:complete